MFPKYGLAKSSMKSLEFPRPFVCDQDMCDISSALYWIIRADGFSAIFGFKGSLWSSHVTRHAMTDKIHEQINQTASKLVQGFKRYGVKSLVGVILLPHGTQ
jgi:hypothetical protein